jgi:hypothetical protein
LYMKISKRTTLPRLESRTFPEAGLSAAEIWFLPASRNAVLVQRLTASS